MKQLNFAWADFDPINNKIQMKSILFVVQSSGNSSLGVKVNVKILAD
ncbi:MAG: hypothetical protein PHE16_08955 [Aliarcobacter sp.]|nr:hypothetical protein [Aliarcobacter sp.]